MILKVDYFMRKRIVDKRKELMYADGAAPLSGAKVAAPNDQ